MKHHKWDTPENKISATCLNCGCVRLAERILGRMSWVYWRKGMGGETPHNPDCKTEITQPK